jgi:hypothetical protein
MNLNNKKAILIIFVLGLIAYLSGLNWQEFTKIDIRYALFIAEMKQYGIGIFPTLYSKPYTDYPSIGVLFMYFASLGGNYINIFTAALPGAITSAITLVLIYLIGARVSKHIGWYSVVISFLSIEYLSQVRGPSLDVYVVFASTLSFYLIYTADLDKKWKLLIIVPLCFIFGFAFRGPLGFMIPSAVVCVYYLVNHKLKQCIIFAILSPVLAVACMAALISLSYVYGGKELVQCFLNDQILNRAESNDYLLYYFIDGLGTYAIIYPLGFFVFIVYFKKLIKNFKDNSLNIHFLRSISAWMMIILILMTIPGAKNPRYIVSIIPAACLLASFTFVNYDKITIFDKLKWLLLWICRIAPFICLLTFITGIIVLRIIKVDISFDIPITLIAFVTLSAAIILVQKKISKENRSFALLAIMACFMTILQIMIIEPIEQNVEGARKFAAEVENIREKNNSQVWFFDFGPDGDELKFLANIPQEKRFTPQFINTALPPEAIPTDKNKCNYTETNALKLHTKKILADLFPDESESFSKIEPRYLCYGTGKIKTLPKETIYISKAKNFENRIVKKLQQNVEIIVSGKMGHQKCVAFRKKN